MPERTFRLFLSSPSDVQPERDRAKAVVERLNGELEGVARIEVLRWEDAFYTAARSFQEAIDAALERMSGTDIVVCIVWSRVGLKLDPSKWRRGDSSSYESGTVLEFETAREAHRRHGGAPDVYLFRKTAEVLYNARRVAEEMEQHEVLEAVFRRWTQTEDGYNRAGYQTFQDGEAFERQFEDCVRQWLAQRGVGLDGPVWERDRKGSPFRGLAHFDAAHASVFFGRETSIRSALAKLRQSPFLLVIGASGSGKSSLLRAGIVPRLARPGMVPGIDGWRTAVVTPGADPFARLAEALCADHALGAELRDLHFGEPAVLAKVLAAGRETARAAIGGALDRAARGHADLRSEAPRSMRLLLGLDQLERLFVEADAATTAAFADVLGALVEGRLACVVAALRSDAYGSFQTVAPLVQLREVGRTLDLLPATSDELEEMVNRPVAACRPRLAFETGPDGRSLAEILVRDARGGDALPLLQMTLQRLYEAEEQRERQPARGDAAEPEDGVLRFSDYPGMDAAVTREAESAVGALDRSAADALPALLTGFVADIDEGVDRGRARIVIAPIARAAFEAGRPERTALVEAFIARRLVTVEDSDGVALLRPVHEALLRTWPEAVRIVDENAALIRVRRTLEPMVSPWARAAGDAKAGHLVTSAALLAGAAQLAERVGGDLPATMRDFIGASLQADARRRNAEKARQRRILLATAAGLVVAVALGSFAALKGRDAREQRDAALAVNVQVNDLVAFLSTSLRDRALPVGVIREMLDRATQLQDLLFASGEPTPALLESSAKTFNELVLALLQQGSSRTEDNLRRAIGLARRFLDFTTRLVAQDPGNPDRQYQLSLGHNRLGDVLAVAGRYGEALAEYSTSLDIRTRLTAASPDRDAWQEAVATAYTKIGDMRRMIGRTSDALDDYDRGLVIRQRLLDRDGADVERRRELAVSLERRGIALAILGRAEQALDAFTQSLAVRKDLADSATPLSRADLSVAYERLGDMLTTLGRIADALDAFRACFDLRKALAAEDPGNQLRRIWLGRAYGRIGQTLVALGRRDEAIAALRDSLDIRERLVLEDPGNVGLKVDLAATLRDLALAGDDRRARLTRAFAILQELKADGKLIGSAEGLIDVLANDIRVDR